VPASIIIDRDQRDGLYEVIRNHLAVTFGSRWSGPGTSRPPRSWAWSSPRTSGCYRTSAGEDGERESFELTMPPSELGKALERLRVEAVEILVESGNEAQTSCEDEDTNRRFQRGHESCEKALADLDQRTGT
jgi:hypothetical protein